MSSADFDAAAKILSKFDVSDLQASSLNRLLEETKTTWRDLVLNSSQVYEQKAANE